jgi:predicted Zn finger-like uncharacterized protein
MIITCQECNANFNLDESLLKSTGSKVRCSKCKKVFIAYPSEPSKETETPIEVKSDPEVEQLTKELETGKVDDSESGELDLPDMEKLFSEEEVVEEDLEDIELDLDLEPEPEKTPEDIEAETKPEELDELDLSDMEKLFAEEEAPDEEVAEDVLEDIELDLDLEDEPKKAPDDIEAEAKPEEPDELDLFDMEELLDITEAPEEKVVEEDLEDIELDLDLEDEPEKAPEDVEAEAKSEEPDELDLSDIEKMLDLEEPETDEEDEPKEVELELDMGMEPELERTPEDIEAGVESEELEEVDLSDIEKMLEIEEEAEIDIEEEPVDSVLLDDISDKPEPDEPFEIEDIEREFEIEDTDQEDLTDEEVADMQPMVAKVRPAEKKRISKPLLVLLILVLLGGGCYGTYVLLDFMNIKIPFISDYLNPQDSDTTGNLMIETLDVDSRFVVNAKAGKLFVITGQIKNGYSDVRSYIRVIGKLYTKGKILAQTGTVFCGNVLLDIELSNMEVVAIKKRLSNRLGDNKSNMQVKPGQELPFMIVFANLPDNLEEFAIEVAGSTPG